MKNMSPWFVTGFTDAEGCFSIKLSKCNNFLGWKVQLDYCIGLHKSDLQILADMKSHFGVGQLSNSGKVAMYSVRSLKEITEVIIPHFDKYPLFTKKNEDFLLFKSAALLMNSKIHLTRNGLQQVINLRASINRGLTLTLKEHFPNTMSVARVYINDCNLNGEWLAGFVSGDGGFGIRNRSNGGTLVFYITQNKRDVELLKSIARYLGCGNVSPSNKGTYNLTVQRFLDIYNIVIPFFNTYEIRGEKYLNYLDWVAAADLIYNGRSKEVIMIIEKKKLRKQRLLT